jgi:MinD superfamily P-loop ATPase
MVRILLKFSGKIVTEPVTSKIILKLKVPINIVTAHIDSKGGEILADVAEESLQKIIEAFREEGATVSIPKQIEVDKDECVSCGACLTLCPVEAITFDKESAITFDKEKCLGSPCGICVDACPARAIKSTKQNNNDSNDNH